MRRVLIILTLALFFLACSKENHALPNRRLQENITVDYRVTAQEAIERAIRAVEGLDQSRQTRTRTLRVADLQVLGHNVGTRTDGAVDTLFYLINFHDNQGYALVAADERNEDVYMMSNEGSLDLEQVGEESPVAFFLDAAANHARDHQLIDTIPGLGNGEQIVDKTDTIGNLLTTIYRGEEYHFYAERTTYTHSCELATRWHQGTPYNNDCFTGNGDQAPAGCVAIAIAQIMAYHQHPTTYNWDAMLVNAPYVFSWSAGAEAVATLVADIGAAVNMTYEVGGSSSDITKARWGLYFHLDYDVGSIISYDIPTIQSNVMAHRPLYIRGESADTAHAWVLDGIRYTHTTMYYYDLITHELVYTEDEGNSSYYVHNNWGWNGVAPAWTLSGVFESSVGNYSNNIQLISYIKPKE